MISILIAIATFSLMLMLFKYFEKFKVNNLQAIVFNYFTAGILSLISSINTKTEIDKILYIDRNFFLSGLLIGFLFIVTFNLLAFGTQKVGIAIATVANKMSMIIPVIVGIYLFNEPFYLLQVAGLILALLAIYFTSTKRGKIEFNKKYLIIIILIFLGQGIADGVLNWAQKTIVNSTNTTIFFAIIFLLAAIIGLLFMLYDLAKNKVKFQLKSIYWGIFLGIPNFLTLYFFVNALQSNFLESAQIFPIVNMGIIIFSTIGGILLFKEKLSSSNWVGIALAVIAIALIT